MTAHATNAAVAQNGCRALARAGVLPAGLRAAIDARDFDLARAEMAPLDDGSANNRPTIRMFLLMADLEEAEHGSTGLVREWLSRASRAARDKAWVADGVVSDVWAPVSPVSGKLDAFVWTTPAERLTEGAPWEPPAAPMVEPAPVIVAKPIEIAPPEPVVEDAAKKLADIRDAARLTPPEGLRGLEPMVTAPDDPGPRKSA